VTGKGAGQVVDVTALDAEGGRHLPEGGASTGPQLAVRPVPEELVGLARGPRSRVEDRFAVVLDDEDRVARLVAAQVGVRGLRPEPVVGVVGADLEGAGRDDEPFAGKEVGEPLPAGGRPRRHGVRREVQLAVAPTGAHELGVRRGHALVVGRGAGRLAGLLGDLGGAYFRGDVRLAHPAHATAVGGATPWIR
jgi:hypothetical protein